MSSDGAPHPDSEQLALLAMEAPVADGVSAHVQSCAECRADLALIRSLMAGGGDGADRGDEWHLEGSADDPVDESVLAAAQEAQADGPEGAPTQEAEVAGSAAVGGVGGGGASASGGGSRTALIVGAVVVVAVLILVALLLWR